MGVQVWRPIGLVCEYTYAVGWHFVQITMNSSQWDHIRLSRTSGNHSSQISSVYKSLSSYVFIRYICTYAYMKCFMYTLYVYYVLLYISNLWIMRIFSVVYHILSILKKNGIPQAFYFFVWNLQVYSALMSFCTAVYFCDLHGDFPPCCYVIWIILFLEHIP